MIIFSGLIRQPLQSDGGFILPPPSIKIVAGGSDKGGSIDMIKSMCRAYLAILVIIAALSCSLVVLAADSSSGSEQDLQLSVQSSEFPSGTLAYSDDFSDKTSGWKRSSTAEESFAYEAGVYKITVNEPYMVSFAYIPGDLIFSNFVAEVEVAAEECQDTCQLGLDLRDNDGDFYRFLIATNGMFSFWKYQNDEWTILINWHESSALNTGNAKNVLKVVCDGDEFTLYANEILLGTCGDSSLTSGEISILAETEESGGLVASFDNLNVWDIGETGASGHTDSVIGTTNGATTGTVAGTITVRPGESIQDAIDTAAEGATIEVQSGTYYENVVVNKRLTLRGIGYPVVDAGDDGSAITLSADGITIEGFAVKNAAGIVMAGIDVGSDGNTIQDNVIENCENGILLYDSSRNDLEGNTIEDCDNHGIYLLSDCDRNNITNNKVSRSYSDGIMLFKSTRNTLTGNTVEDCDCGIYLLDSSDNKIFKNSMIDNSYSNAYDDFDSAYSDPNLWDDGSVGNYYSDLDCTDSDGDGICEMSYLIEGGTSIDRYPMASPGSVGTTVGTTSGTGAVTVTSSTSTSSSSSITSTEPGTVSTTEGARISVPAGAVPRNADGSAGTMVFSIEQDSTKTPVLQGEFVPLGSVYQLGPEGFTFDTPVEVILPIPSDVDPSSVIGVTTFNATSNQWEMIPGVVDPVARTVTIRTYHFSPYSIFGLSGSADPEAWNRANGGWIEIVNTHQYESGSYGECQGEENCRRLPVHTENGICIQGAVLDNPSIWGSWTPPTEWTILASDYHPYSAEPTTIRYWVPAGTYTLVRFLFESEVNHNPLYSPCYHARSMPAQQYRVNPGETLRFDEWGELSDSSLTCTPGGYPCGSRVKDTAVGTGDVQVTLTWHSYADIDLYVQDPNGDTVSYQYDSVPSGGQLDRDNRCSNFEMGRAENIFWPENGAPSGTYRVWVNYYSDCSDVGPVAWTVRTVVKGQAKTYSGTINEVGDDQDVTTFTV